MDRIGIGLLYIMLILTSLYATVGTLILLAGLADYYIREEKIQGKKNIEGMALLWNSNTDWVDFNRWFLRANPSENKFQLE